MLGWYPESVAMADPEAALAALASGRITESAVAVETAPGEDPPASPSDGGSRDGPLAVPHRRVHAARFEAEASLLRAGWLVLRETAHRGWRVRVDGRTTPWSYADGMFVGIPIAEGQHTVEFVFRPRSMELAWIAAGCGLAVVICLALTVRGSRSRA
jgi:hypothetical protein